MNKGNDEWMNKGKNGLITALAVWSGEEAISAELKLISDTFARHPTTWVTAMCQEPATGGAGFLCNLSKCFFVCHRLSLLLV